MVPGATSVGDKMTETALADLEQARKTALIVLNMGGNVAAAFSDFLVHLGGDAAASRSDPDAPISLGQLNRAVLESAGNSLDEWTAFNQQWLSSPKAAEFHEEALKIVEAEFDGSFLMVIDDPALIRLLPFWNLVFERANIVPRYVFALEDAATLAARLGAEQLGEARNAHLVWLRAMLEAEYHSRDRLRAFVDPRLLATRPIATTKALAASLKLTFPRDVQSLVNRGGNSLRSLRSLHDQPATTDAPQGESAELTDWVKVAQLTLSAWSDKGESIDARDVLDAVREAFDDAAPAFAAISQRSGASDAEYTLLLQDLDAMRAEMVEGEEREARLEQRLAEQQSGYADLRSELSGRISYLESALAQRRAELDDARQLIDERGRRTRVLEEEVASYRAIADQQLQQHQLQLEQLREQAKAAAEEYEEQLRDRYREIVTLSRKFAVESANAQRLQHQATRLASIAQVLERSARGGWAARWIGWILPARLQMRLMKRHIEQSGAFDGGAYLAANPDVARAGVDPLRHYLTHGAEEGRPLGID